MSSELLERTVARTVAQYGMFAPGETVAVGFSGGADSTALLYYLFTHAEEYGITVRAVHIHHGIRAHSADRDAQFCRAFCDARGIPLDVERRDVPALAAERGMGIEECARSVRYEAFDTLLACGHAGRVATAHHAQDNLETALFHIARGTSLRGAAGIPPVRGHFVRPLIACTRAQILDYLHRANLTYVTDETNADRSYTRNRIRAQALPALETANERVYEHFTALSERLRTDDAFLYECAQKAKNDQISDLRALPRSILTRVLVLLWEDYSDLPLGSTHIDALCTLVHTGGQGATVGLPSGRARIDRGALIFCGLDTPAPFVYRLTVGENVFSDLGCMILLTTEEIGQKQADFYRNIYKKLIHSSIKFDKISSVYIRSREPGDAYRSFGMTRTVKKLLQQDKLTEAQRVHMPVFCDDEGILWLPGHGVRDGAWDEDGFHIYYCSGE